MPYRMPSLVRLSWLASTAQRIASSPEDWLDLVHYDTDERWYLRLACDDEHEVWLLSWLPGQHTCFHDHGASAGAFAVAVGSLAERCAPDGRPEHTHRELAQGAVRSFGANYVHNVANNSDRPAISARLLAATHQHAALRDHQQRAAAGAQARQLLVSDSSTARQARRKQPAEGSWGPRIRAGPSHQVQDLSYCRRRGPNRSTRKASPPTHIHHGR
jgi:predicted metal-dependent enzyme (double-stranded beta helix superfamily)